MDLTNKPLVSVLMTSYNSENFIREAIESVINSDFKDFELIIIDDRSTDNSYFVASEMAKLDKRIFIYLNEINLGDYPNRILAAKFANGKYIKYVDCDDKIDSNCLRIMVEAMESNPEVGLGLCCPNTNEIEVLSPIQSYSNTNGILEYFGPSGSIINKEKYNYVGGFKSLITVSDWDMWHRLAAKWSIISFPPNLVTWRDHPNNALKSKSHRIGVIKFYLKTKYDILNSADCPLGKLQVNNLLKTHSKNILKYSIKCTFNEKTLSYLFTYLQFNTLISLKIILNYWLNLNVIKLFQK